MRRRRATALAILAALLLGIVLIASSGGAAHPPAPAHRTAAARPHPVAAPTEQQAALTRFAAAGKPIYCAGRGHRLVALTFDDGPGPDTPRIVSILRRYHVPATFFVLGRSAQSHAGRVGLRAEADGGFVIGDHTMTHPMLASMGEAGQKGEIVGQARLLHQMAKPRPILFRPPFGSFNATTLGVLRTEHMLGVLWTADTKDYEMPGKKQIIYTAVSAAQPGAIVLMHDGPTGRSETAEALPRIITRLRQRHYKLVTVPQMMRENPPARGTPAPTPLSGGG